LKKNKTPTVSDPVLLHFISSFYETSDSLKISIPQFLKTVHGVGYYPSSNFVHVGGSSAFLGRVNLTCLIDELSVKHYIVHDNVAPYAGGYGRQNAFIDRYEQ